MSDAEFFVDLDGRDPIANVIAALRKQEKAIPRRLRAEIIDVAGDLADEASRKVLAQPTTGTEHTGLRRRIARGVHVVRKPAGARISTRVNETDEKYLPRGFDDPVKGWAHPVFGHMDNWVRQTATTSWFMDTMQDAEDILTPRLQEVLEDAAEFVDNAANLS